MSQVINARTAYEPEDILFDHRFVDMFRNDPAGRLVIDFAHFDEVVKLRPSSSG